MSSFCSSDNNCVSSQGCQQLYEGSFPFGRSPALHVLHVHTCTQEGANQGCRARNAVLRALACLKRMDGRKYCVVCRQPAQACAGSHRHTEWLNTSHCEAAVKARLNMLHTHTHMVYKAAVLCRGLRFTAHPAGLPCSVLYHCARQERACVHVRGVFCTVTA